MILDKNTTLMRRGDAAATVTKTIPLGGDSVTGNTSGMAPYKGAFLVASATAAVASLMLTLEHADTETGTFATLAVYGPFTGVTDGMKLIDAELPLATKNWIRISMDNATVIEASVAVDARKGWPHV